MGCLPDGWIFVETCVLTWDFTQVKQSEVDIGLLSTNATRPHYEVVNWLHLHRGLRGRWSVLMFYHQLVFTLV